MSLFEIPPLLSSGKIEENHVRSHVRLSGVRFQNTRCPDYLVSGSRTRDVQIILCPVPEHEMSRLSGVRFQNTRCPDYLASGSRTRDVQ